MDTVRATRMDVPVFTLIAFHDACRAIAFEPSKRESDLEEDLPYELNFECSRNGIGVTSSGFTDKDGKEKGGSTNCVSWVASSSKMVLKIRIYVRWTLKDQ